MVPRLLSSPQLFLMVSQILETTRGPPSPVSSYYKSQFNNIKSVLTPQTLVAVLIFHGSSLSFVIV